MRQLSITDSSGRSITLARYDFPEEKRTVSRSLQRAPLTDHWFSVGDGRWNPAALAIEAHISEATLEESISKFTELVRISRDATLVRWGEFRRPVNGLLRMVRSPLVIGYRVLLEFAPTGDVWLDDEGGEVYL